MACLLVGLPLLPRQVAAQYPVHAYLSPSIIEINLQPETLALAAPGFRVEQVVDARPDTTTVGMIRRGACMQRVQFRQGAAREVQVFLNNQLNAPTGARPVLLRLTGASAVEYPAKAFVNDIATELIAEYYARQPDNTYFLLCRVSNNTHHTSGEPARQHATNVAELLRRGLEQVDRVDWAAQQAAGPFYSLAQLQRPAALQLFPIQTTAPLRAGVYGSFLEFRDNLPGLPGNVTVDARGYVNTAWQGLRAVDPFLLTPEGRRVAVEDAWGFCDGQQVYVRQGKDYFLVERRGPIFMFFAPGHQNNSGLINGGPPKTPFSLDLQNGLVMEYTGVASGPAAPLNSRPTHLMVYWRRDKNTTPLAVQLNGAAVGQLQYNDYLSLPWQDTGQPVRLCVGTDLCVELMPSFTEANYIEYQPGLTPVLRKVPVREGAAQVSRMAGR